MINLSAEIIANGVTYEIINLSSIEFSGQDRSNPSLPSWGIQSNSGKLQMRDDEKLIHDLKINGSLANSYINVYLKANSRKVELGKFKVSDVYKEPQSEIITLEFADVLPSWQNIQLKKYYYPYEQKVSVKVIIDTIIARANFVASSSIFLYADDATDEWLKNYFIPFPIIDEGSLWSQMSKICEISSCYIYCDEIGMPNIYYGGDT